MTCKKQGKHSFLLTNQPVISAWASVAGKKEAEGPLGKWYDRTSADTFFGKKTWEQAEQQMQQTALRLLLKKSGCSREELDAVFSGDLLNQCISSSFILRNQNIPHLGLYGACSTMAESLLLASAMVDGGYLQNAAAMSSSHFAASERQYRFPLAYGGQRTPTAQRTVTGAGAALLRPEGSGPRIESATIGTIHDLGIKDANNMGAAMAPAAYDTIRTHLEDLNAEVSDFDLIVTGDLGKTGTDLLLELARRDGLPLSDRLRDCGTMVFDPTAQDVHAGGSGCGCSAIALCSYLLHQLSTGALHRILFCGTGALLSPVSMQQGLSIPAVCHCIAMRYGGTASWNM